MAAQLYAVDMEGQCYVLTAKDGRINSWTLLEKAYAEGLRICIATGGQCMLHTKYSSWHAPAYVDAIQPDARIGRSVADCVATIKNHQSLKTITI